MNSNNGNNNNNNNNKNWFIDRFKNILPGSNQNKQNINNQNNNNNNSKEEQIIKRKEYELAQQKELEIKEMQKQNELEEQIRDHLKCYICLSKVTKPRMCKYCKKISCENCILNWLGNHPFCGICKHNVIAQDMIPLPFLDDMSAFFISNIDNRPKRKTMYNNSNNSKNIIGNQNKKNYSPNKRLNNKDNNIIYEKKEFNKLNIINEKDEENKKEDICNEHGHKIDYYCVQCDKYFCSQCLIFFGKEVNKHKNHFILKVEKINDLGVADAINEYRKLPATKDKIEELIGLCNMKIKENEIKKYEIITLMNSIKNSYINKIEENANNIDEHQHNIKKYKNEIPLFLNNINNMLNQEKQNYIQSPEFLQKLKSMNTYDTNLEKDILEKSKINPKLYLENYQTDYIDINLGKLQFQENEDILNYTFKLIPGYPFKLIFKYLANKVIIDFIVTINVPLNSPSFPIFHNYIIFKKEKYGLEFINIPKKNIPGNNIVNSIEQTNEIELDFQKFLFLCSNDNKITIKIVIIKEFYQ